MTLAIRPEQDCRWDQISLGEAPKSGKTEVIVEGARNFVAIVKYARNEMVAARTGAPNPLG